MQGEYMGCEKGMRLGFTTFCYSHWYKEGAFSTTTYNFHKRR
jgi:hypothetical protein